MTKNDFSRRRFLKTSGLATMGALAARKTALSRPSPELTLYIGTYTSSTSEGIYVYRLNSDTGELKMFSSIKSENPSFLTLDRSKRFLYAVNELKEFAGQASGAVSAYAIDAAGKLKFLNQQPTLGADPCYVTVDRRRSSLLVANYTGGNITLLPINRDGSLDQVADRKQHEGKGIKEQQNGPHAHCIILDPSERYALAADLGIDKVMIYSFSPRLHELLPAKQPSVSLKPGAGPRHLTLHPNGRFLYAINELDSTLTTLKYSAGTLTTMDTVSTLPEGFTDVSYCADVHVSPSGKFLYGSNRGHNSIVVFALDASTGKPTLVEHVSTEGKWPRNFVIDPTGKFLLVANQHTDNVVVFNIDAQTGRLKPSGHVATVPIPVCLKFR